MSLQIRCIATEKNDVSLESEGFSSCSTHLGRGIGLHSRTNPLITDQNIALGTRATWGIENDSAEEMHMWF